ncbi:zinc-binding dehydrogenase [Chloroflexota bacterium]
MLAAQLVGPRRVELGEVAKPACGDGQVLVKVRYTAVCGTDIATYREAKVALPRIPGHEITGVVAQTGRGVTRFETGDRVVIHPVCACGRCKLCNEGKSYLCAAGGLLGRESDGGLAEYVVADEPDVFPIPEGVSFAEATQIQTLSTVYHSQQRLRVEPGKGLMVVGMGVTGFLHVQLARASGAIPVIAVSRSPWKLELARELGADEAISTEEPDAQDRIKEATGGQGPEAVIEAVGVPSTVAFSIESVAPGGRVLLYGSGHQPLTGFDPYLIYFKEINLIGSRAAGRADWPPVLNLVRSGRINLKPLITHVLPLAEVARAFSMMDEQAAGVIRIAVEMPE